MKIVYEVIGSVVFWSISVYGVVFMLYKITPKTIKLFIKSDKVHYMLGGSYETDYLVKVYESFSQYENVKKMVLKFRLRNIKRARK